VPVGLGVFMAFCYIATDNPWQFTDAHKAWSPRANPLRVLWWSLETAMGGTVCSETRASGGRVRCHHHNRRDRRAAVGQKADRYPLVVPPLRHSRSELSGNPGGGVPGACLALHRRTVPSASAFSSVRGAMEQPIIGFHQDEQGDWVAELACGHGQHVRHNPPWSERPWVTTHEQRAQRIGQHLACRQCDDPEPGQDVNRASESA